MLLRRFGSKGDGHPSSAEHSHMVHTHPRLPVCTQDPVVDSLTFLCILASGVIPIKRCGISRWVRRSQSLPTSAPSKFSTFTWCAHVPRWSVTHTHHVALSIQLVTGSGCWRHSLVPGHWADGRVYQHIDFIRFAPSPSVTGTKKWGWGRGSRGVGIACPKFMPPTPPHNE